MIKNDFNLRLSLLITVFMIAGSCFVYFYKNRQYSYDAFLYKANHSFSNESFFDAAKYYRKLISMGTDDAEVYQNAATSLIKLGDYKKSVRYLNRIIKKHPSSDLYYALADAYYRRSKIYLSKHDLEISIEQLEKAIELNDQNENAYHLIGQIYKHLGRFEHARTWYRRALLEGFSNQSEFYGLIGHTYFEEGRLDDALKYYERAVGGNINYIAAYCQMGEIYKKQGKIDDAVDIYKKAIGINSEYAVLYYKIGNLYDDQKDYHEAIEWYKKALAIEENNDLVNYYIGVAYKNIGMHGQAVKHLKQSAYCGNDDAVYELRTLLVTF